MLEAGMSDDARRRRRHDNDDDDARRQFVDVVTSSQLVALPHYVSLIGHDHDQPDQSQTTSPHVTSDGHHESTPQGHLCQRHESTITQITAL